MSERLSIYEANMRRGLESYAARRGDLQMPSEMAFDEVMSAEHDGLEGEIGEYEWAQRRAAVRAVYRYFLAEGPHPLKIMKRVFALGRGLRVEFFSDLTMEEAGMMFGETKAAHSWRVKFLSGLIKRTGQIGARLPGQKSEAATPSYVKAQQGNQNRRRPVVKRRAE